MISPLLRQSFLLSSSTVFMFSIQTASTGPSNMYQRFSSVIDEAPIRINAGKMPSVLHTHRTCCKSARHWLYQRRQDAVCPVHTQNVLQVGPSLAVSTQARCRLSCTHTERVASRSVTGCINAGKMPSVLHTHRTCCKSVRHWLYQRRQNAACPTHTHRTCCKSVRHWLTAAP